MALRFQLQKFNMYLVVLGVSAFGRQSEMDRAGWCLSSVMRRSSTVITSQLGIEENTRSRKTPLKLEIMFTCFKLRVVAKFNKRPDNVVRFESAASFQTASGRMKSPLILIYYIFIYYTNNLLGSLTEVKTSSALLQKSK